MVSEWMPTALVIASLAVLAVVAVITVIDVNRSVKNHFEWRDAMERRGFDLQRRLKQLEAAGTPAAAIEYAKISAELLRLGRVLESGIRSFNARRR